jgi:hypothetical protein
LCGIIDNINSAIDTFIRYLQLNPMLKQSGASIPYIALSLYLSPSNFKKGYIISAVFKISMFNHSNGAYFGCQGSLPNSFFHPESNYYKLHEHIQVKFSKCDMELVGTDLIMCIKLLLLRLNVYEVYI